MRHKPISCVLCRAIRRLHKIGTVVPRLGLGRKATRLRKAQKGSERIRQTQVGLRLRKSAIILEFAIGKTTMRDGTLRKALDIGLGDGLGHAGIDIGPEGS